MTMMDEAHKNDVSAVTKRMAAKGSDDPNAMCERHGEMKSAQCELKKKEGAGY